MARESAAMLYDAATDIGIDEYEQIVQALVWVADYLIAPSYALAGRRLADDESRHISRHLAELAEAGLIRRWCVDVPMPQLAPVRWWPKSTQEVTISREEYLELRTNVRDGTSRYRNDLMRGVGRPTGSMMSGVTEFVQLQEMLWTFGLSRALDTDFLLSTQRRSTQVQAPILRLSPVARAADPASETIMQLHGIGPLRDLSVRDLKRLRRSLPAIRAQLTRIALEADRDVLTPADSRKMSEAVAREARARYAELMRVKEKGEAATSRRSTLTGLGITVAGTIFPPLGALGFIQPLLSLDPRHREERRFVLFLRRLRRLTKERS